MEGGMIAVAGIVGGAHRVFIRANDDARAGQANHLQDNGGDDVVSEDSEDEFSLSARQCYSAPPLLPLLPPKNIFRRNQRTMAALSRAMMTAGPSPQIPATTLKVISPSAKTPPAMSAGMAMLPLRAPKAATTARKTNAERMRPQRKREPAESPSRPLQKPLMPAAESLVVVWSVPLPQPKTQVVEEEELPPMPLETRQPLPGLRGVPVVLLVML